MGRATSKLLSQQLAEWRVKNWPPAELRQYVDKDGIRLPIYYGKHDIVASFGEKLADIMQLMSTHVMDECRGRVPKWMTIPKLHFGVVRLNITTSTAKASRRFYDTDSLVAKCGTFTKKETKAMDAWLQEQAGAVLVAHRSFIDLRSYVFKKTDDKPARERFYECGLVLAVEDGFIIQDNRGVVRSKRSDAYNSPIASSDRWRVFALVEPSN